MVPLHIHVESLMQYLDMFIFNIAHDISIVCINGNFQLGFPHPLRALALLASEVTRLTLTSRLNLFITFSFHFMSISAVCPLVYILLAFVIMDSHPCQFCCRVCLHLYAQQLPLQCQVDALHQRLILLHLCS